MRCLRFLSLSSIVLACGALPAFAQLQLQSGTPAVLQAGASSARFTLHNAGTVAVPLSLSVGAIVDETSQAALSSPKVTLQMEAAGQPVPQSIASQQNLYMSAVIAGMTTSADAQIRIFNGLEPLGTLEAVAADAPLNISVSGNGSSATAPLIFARGKKAWLTLKNGGPEAYSLNWAFHLHDMESHGSIVLLANGSRVISIDAQDGVYSWTDYIHPSSQTGHLVLSLLPPSPASKLKLTLPSRDLPVSLTMQRTSENKTTLLSDLYVIVALLIGGFLSVLITGVLPVSRRRSAFHAQLADLANRTSSVSTRVDSYLRVLLRLERKKIDVALAQTKPFYPSASSTLDNVDTEIDRLTRRLTVAERIDDLHRRLEASWATAPPSVVADVDAKLRAAADFMHSFALTDDTVTAAGKCLDAATASLTATNNSADLAKQIATSFTDLTTRIKSFDLKFDDLSDALPGVFKILDEPFGDAKNLTPAMIYGIDHSIAAINLVLDYAVIRQTVVVKPGEGQENDTLDKNTPDKNSQATKAPAPAPDPNPDPAHPQQARQDVPPPHQDLKSADTAAASPQPKEIVPVPNNPVCENAKRHQYKLIELLGARSWQCLREAQILVQEMRENIYEQDVLDQFPDHATLKCRTEQEGRRDCIGAEDILARIPESAKLTFDTQKARRYLPVNFYVEFRDSKFKEAAALQRLAFEWDFPNNLQEKGAKVCHFFDGTEPECPPARDSAGKPVGDVAVESSPQPDASRRLPLNPTDLDWPAFLSWLHGRPSRSLTVRVWVTVQRQKSPPSPRSADLPQANPGAAGTAQPSAAPPPSTQPQNDARTLTNTIEIKGDNRNPDRSRALTEALQFFIAFGVALAGLLAGGIEQLGKLDLIPATFAIIGLGFGADAVKNLLTQPAKKS